MTDWRDASEGKGKRKGIRNQILRGQKKGARGQEGRLALGSPGLDLRAQSR